MIGAGNHDQREPFGTGDTLASRIAEQFIGAVSELQTSSLFYCAWSCSYGARRQPRGAADRAPLRAPRRERRADVGRSIQASPLAAERQPAPPPARRPRDARSATAAAVLAVAVLVIVIVTVVQQGASQLIDLVPRKDPAGRLGAAAAASRHAIVGSALIVAVATAIALPVGVLIAIYLTEFATPRPRWPIRLALDLLNGMPSIVIGVFVFGLLVVGARPDRVRRLVRARDDHGAADRADDAGDAAAGAARRCATPPTRSASAAGARSSGSSCLRARRASSPATVLAVARAAGETAPLLLLGSIFRQRNDGQRVRHRDPEHPDR